MNKRTAFVIVLCIIVLLAAGVLAQFPSTSRPTAASAMEALKDFHEGRAKREKTKYPDEPEPERPPEPWSKEIPCEFTEAGKPVGSFIVEREAATLIVTVNQR